MVQSDTRILHVRFAGRSEELDRNELGLQAEATDDAIREALARRYGRDKAALASYVVARENGAIIVRPSAIYG